MAERDIEEIDLAAAQLAAQLGECHDAVMAVFKFAAGAPNADVQMNAMKTATRMMQASAAAAASLKRLKSLGTHHTVTVVREGEGTPSQKSKTNGHGETHRA
jgi:hypothetical protein